MSSDCRASAELGSGSTEWWLLSCRSLPGRRSLRIVLVWLSIIVIQAFLADLMLCLCILGWVLQSGGKLLVLLLGLCIRTVLSPTSIALVPELQI